MPDHTPRVVNRHDAAPSRRIELVRGGWGGALLLAPHFVLEQALRSDTDDRAVSVVRVLGARQLAQAALSGIRPSSDVLAVGVWVDLVHAATALVLAGSDRNRVRAGLIDAVVAGAWAFAGYRDLRSEDPFVPVLRRDRLAAAVLRVVPGGSLLLRQINRRRKEES